MTALVAAHARKTFGQVAAPHELVGHFWDQTAQHDVARLIVARVRGHEAIKVRVIVGRGPPDALTDSKIAPVPAKSFRTPC